MNPPTSLKDLERSLYRSSTQDGLIDIQVGSVLLVFAIAPLLSARLGDFWSSAIFLPFWAAVFYAARVFRRSQLQPRIGQIKFGPYRIKRLKNLTSFILVFNLAAFGLGLLAFFGLLEFPGWLPLSILLPAGFCLVGYTLESSRFYLYAIISALTPITGEYLFRNHGFSHHGYPIAFGVLSGTILAWGIILSIRVIRKYPLEDNGGRE